MINNASYTYLFIFILLFSCKTVADFPSLFRQDSSLGQNLANKKIVIKEINNSKNYYEVITLKNGFKVILNQSDIARINISISLKNPPSYQSYTNSGVECLLLTYIKNIITEKVSKLNLKDFDFNTSIFANKDMSRLLLSFDKKEYLKDMLGYLYIFGDRKFDYDELDRIKVELLKNFNKTNDNYKMTLFDQSERNLFRSKKFQNNFWGNSLSLKLIKPEDVALYYRENFVIRRIMLFINGKIEKKDIKIEYFNYIENNFANNIEKDIDVERLSNKDFNNDPLFFNENLKDISFFVCFYRAPSFLNDEYFSYLIAIKILKNNLFDNTYLVEKPELISNMINLTNYGSISFLVKNRDLQSTLLSIKKIVEIQKKQFGYFKFYKDNTSDFTRDYKNQNENRLVNLTSNFDFDNIKEEIYKEFNFDEINGEDKEIKFISTYFLFEQKIEPTMIKEKLDMITDKDLLKIFDNYFFNLSWYVLTNQEISKTISKDFFYR